MKEASIPGRVFLYGSLLGMVEGCPHTLQRLASHQSFIQCSLRIALCSWQVSKYYSSNMRALVPENKLFAYLKRRSIYFSTGHLWLPRASVVRFSLRWSCSSIQRTPYQPRKELHSFIYGLPYSSTTTLWSQIDHRGMDRILALWTNQNIMLPWNQTSEVESLSQPMYL